MHSRHFNWIYNLVIVVEGLLVFGFIFLSIFAYANWDAVKSEFTYALNNHTASEATPTVIPSTTPQPIFEPAHIVIDKINADLPLQWDVPYDQTIDALNHGVAHLKGTARLGQIGNLFITGHSSDYVWKHNPYSAAFALLPKMKVGDLITIRENGKTYIYKVAQTQVVNPDQVEITKPTTTPVLTLLTCYPVGTTRQRFVVQASLVSSPEKPVPIEQIPNQTLPAIKFR